MRISVDIMQIDEAVDRILQKNGSTGKLIPNSRFDHDNVSNLLNKDLVTEAVIPTKYVHTSTSTMISKYMNTPSVAYSGKKSSSGSKKV